MKQEIPIPVIVATVVLVALIVGLIGWKMLGGGSDVQSPESVKLHYALKKRKD